MIYMPSWKEIPAAIMVGRTLVSSFQEQDFIVLLDGGSDRNGGLFMPG